MQYLLYKLTSIKIDPIAKCGYSSNMFTSTASVHRNIIVLFLEILEFSFCINFRASIRYTLVIKYKCIMH